MDPTVEAALISAAATLIGVGGTVIVAVSGARTTRQTSQATSEAALEAQLADRYSRAIEQVGSDSLDVRIGGIYALEGIAIGSMRYHPTVMEVLSGFIREHSRIPPQGVRPDPWPHPDVRAALTVIQRRKKDHDIRRMDLTGVNFNRADLRGVHLDGVDFRDADLRHADLGGMDWRPSDLTGVNFSGADLRDANLGAAILSDANFNHTNLTGTQLGSADLTNARLIGANLTNAHLMGADLLGAHLDHADLDGADLRYTRWPKGVPIPRGWKLRRDGRLDRETEH